VDPITFEAHRHVILKGHEFGLNPSELPANETGLPMTYMLGGRQFIVVAVGATGFPAELVALALSANAGR